MIPRVALLAAFFVVAIGSKVFSPREPTWSYPTGQALTSVWLFGNATTLARRMHAMTTTLLSATSDISALLGETASAVSKDCIVWEGPVSVWGVMVKPGRDGRLAIDVLARTLARLVIQRERRAPIRKERLSLSALRQFCTIALAPSPTPSGSQPRRRPATSVAASSASCSSRSAHSCNSSRRRGRCAARL